MALPLGNLTELLTGQDIGLGIVKLLAVLGGAFVGALFSGLIVQAIVRFWLHKQVPNVVLTGVRTLGGAAVAMLVFLWAFTDAGAGFLGGGGGWFPFGGKSGDKGAADAVVAKDSVIDKEKKPPVPNGDKPPHKGETLRVEMLGGERYKDDNRFYLIEGDKAPLTLTDLIAVLEERQQKAPGVKEVEIIIYDKGSVAESHPAVVDLKKRVLDRGLTVKTTKPGRDAP